MISNYLKIAWRNLRKNKIFSFINILGLSVGLTCCMLIAFYLQHELSYDTQHKNGKQLYQLGTIFIREGKNERSPNTPAPMAAMLQQSFPEIIKTTRLVRLFADDKTLMQYTTPKNEVRSFYETTGFVADSTFFQLLTYDFKEGNPATALTESNSVVLSEEIANKMFGKEPALNKIIHISGNSNGDYNFKITGVFKPSTTPSHINARFIMSMKGGGVEQYMLQRKLDLATNNMFFTYLLLRPDADPAKLEKKFPAFIDKYAGADLKAMGFYRKQFLIPVKDVHLYANTTSNVTPGGSVTYLYILLSIALFTLLIACINFMNLSTARSSKRSTEVGVRKVLGAERSSLIRQFLSESVLMSLLAMILALVLTSMLLPLFSQASGKDLHFSFQQQGWLVAVFFVLSVITGLVAGSYPAFYLSSFKPVKVLKGRMANSLAAISLRKVLVVFQFVISAVLIIASVVISNQMNYLRSKDLGFEKDQQIVIPLLSPKAKNIYASLKNELGRIPQIKSIGASLYYPGINDPSDIPFYKEGGSMNDSKDVVRNFVDYNFLQTLNVHLAAGRLFSPEFPSDTNDRIIFNETAVKQMGYKSAADAVGKKALVDWQGKTYSFEIIGVVKDFHFKDLHSAIEPFGFELNNDQRFNYIVAHASAANMNATLNAVKTAWNKLNPNEPLAYSFLDEDFQKNYEADERLSSLVSYFTIVAILISCLGLFGLAAFSVEQRTKEIGIRKVLGAGILNITTLLSRDFIKPVFLGIVIASPLAWYIMHSWLQNFAYPITMSWWMFALAGALALLIAIFTISFQAIRAAITNPVKALRSE